MSKQNNSYFESHTADYAEQIMAIQPEFYNNSKKIINTYMRPKSMVLDIGNGGVIHYDYTMLNRLDCADLVVSTAAVKKYEKAENIRFFKADILNLSEIEDNIYDTVIIQTVIHHLAGTTYAKTVLNVHKSIQEVIRVTKPGGNILIIESTVCRWFELIERILYPIMQLFFRICKFGLVYQFSAKSLLQVISNMHIGCLSDIQPVSIGPRIWIMGKSIPTCLTPCSAVFLKIHKAEDVS